jgi:hypothetical protein
MKRANPHCSVAGCKTDKPHADDPAIKAVIIEFSDPEKMTSWVLHGMAELAYSICRDIAENRVFAWHTRLRQPEELYVRTLYALFIADEKELHHLLSGKRPNGLSVLYQKVNATVFEGRGVLQTIQAGLGIDSFTPMDTLNGGSHVSFPAFLTCIGLVKHPEFMPTDFQNKYTEHMNKYCTYLQYMNDLFKAGRTKEQVLAAVVSLHRPASYWQEKAKTVTP